MNNYRLGEEGKVAAGNKFQILDLRCLDIKEQPTEKFCAKTASSEKLWIEILYIFMYQDRYFAYIGVFVYVILIKQVSGRSFLLHQPRTLHFIWDNSSSISFNCSLNFILLILNVATKTLHFGLLCDRGWFLRNIASQESSRLTFRKVCDLAVSYRSSSSLTSICFQIRHIWTGVRHKELSFNKII